MLKVLATLNKLYLPLELCTLIAMKNLSTPITLSTLRNPKRNNLSTLSSPEQVEVSFSVFFNFYMRQPFGLEVT